MKISKTVILCGLSFGAGGAIGALATYMIARNKLKKAEDKYIGEINDILNQSDEAFRERMEGYKSTAKKEEDVIIPDAEPGSSPTKERNSIRHMEKTDPIDYTSYYKVVDPAEAQHPSEEDDEEAMNEFLTRERREKRKRPPHIISNEEFGEELGYATVYIDYYTEDGVLIDTGDDEQLSDIDEIRDMLGDVLTQSNFAESRAEELSIVNDKYRTYYKISKVYNSYSRLVQEGAR